jgi:hypothetical protein
MIFLACQGVSIVLFARTHLKKWIGHIFGLDLKQREPISLSGGGVQYAKLSGTNDE